MIKGTVEAILSFNELNATMRRAKRGNAEAQFSLARAYESFGDHEEAERWYAQAEANGNREASPRHSRN
jgi:TPR repeat protein